MTLSSVLICHVFLVLQITLCVSRVQPFATNGLYVARHAPLSMGFCRQEYWSGLSFHPPGVLPNPGIKPAPHVFPALQADSLPTEPLGKPEFQYLPLKIEQ